MRKQQQAAQLAQIGGLGYVFVEDDLTELTNRTVDLIHAGKYDEAERACEQLRERYPDAIDWMDRTAMLHQARGDFARAAVFYRRTLAHTEDPRHADGFDDEGRQYYRDMIEKMERTADSS